LINKIAVQRYLNILFCDGPKTILMTLIEGWIILHLDYWSLDYIGDLENYGHLVWDEAICDHFIESLDCASRIYKDCFGKTST